MKAARHAKVTEARPVDVVLGEMESIRQKERIEKLDQGIENCEEVTQKYTVCWDKKKGRGKNGLKRPVVRWKFVHDAKIPRIMTMDTYLKTIDIVSRHEWDFSSDESLERVLEGQEVNMIFEE